MSTSYRQQQSHSRPSREGLIPHSRGSALRKAVTRAQIPGPVAGRTWGQEDLAIYLSLSLSGVTAFLVPLAASTAA